jgi:hypothetical protein
MRSITTIFIIFGIIIVAGSSCSSQAKGILSGHVDIGPLQPVERMGEPQPTPSPEMYAAWQIVVLSEDGKSEIARAEIDSGGEYQVIIPVGKYMVTAKPANGEGLGAQQVQPAEIFNGKTTYLDISLATGIR